MSPIWIRTCNRIAQTSIVCRTCWRYQLNWIIGRGGMSTVWLARDTEAQRDVAVKILKPEYTENEEFRTRFRNEASAAEQLNSPNVVATYDYGEVRDRGSVLLHHHGVRQW